MSPPANTYAVQRDQVAQYFYWLHIFWIVVTGIWIFGLGLAVAIVYAFTCGGWLPQKQAQALQYWLDGATLRVDQGVFFLKRKAIPLDRVTDVTLVQGPLMRWCNIWAVQIETAGRSGQAGPEAILYGVKRPEEIRDQLLKARDDAVGRATG